MIDTNKRDRLVRAVEAYRRGDLSRREFQAIVLATVGAVADTSVALDVLLTGEVAGVLKTTADLLAQEELISLGSTPHIEPENEDAGAQLFSILIQRGTEAFRGLDFFQAAGNVLADAKGDWFPDPWGLPEASWLAERGHHVLDAMLIAKQPPVYATRVDAPKATHSYRPSTILDPLGRLIYQAIVDAESAQLTGGLVDWTFGWRVPQGSNTPGAYAKNNYQWTDYIARINSDAELNPNALRTDIEDFFSSINPDYAVPSLFSDSSHTEYLTRLISAWNDQTGRSGLPQRCLASSVIANSFLATIDDAITREWHPLPQPTKGAISAARWMDDFWIFWPTTYVQSEIEGPVREAIGALGLKLNEEKTTWLDGESLLTAVGEVNFSYELVALESEPPDPAPLVDRAIDLLQRTSLGRTEVSFLAKTARRHGLKQILDLLIDNIDKLWAGTDHLCRVLREAGRSNELEGWFVRTLRYSESAWVKSSLFELLPKETAASINVLTAIEEAAEQDQEHTVMASALSFLSTCDPDRAIEIIRRRVSSCNSPAFCRSLALAGVSSKMERLEITRILALFPECFATLEMLRDLDFRLPARDGR